MEKNKEEKVSDIDIEKWAEGNEHLKKLLISCRENNVPSMFCCAGHGKNQAAYITLQMCDETLGKIYNIMKSIVDVKNVVFRFAQKEFGLDPSFTLYMLKEKDKKGIMNIISEAITKEEKLENLPSNFKHFANISNLLKNNDIGFDIEYKIGKKKNNLVIQNLKFANAKYIEKTDFKEMGFKFRKDMFGKYNYYIKNISKGEKEFKILNNVIERLNKIYNNEIKETNTDKLNFRQRVVKKITSNTLLKRIPIVNKFLTNNLSLLPESIRKKGCEFKYKFKKRIFDKFK